LGFGFDPLRPDATPENVSMAHLVKEIMGPPGKARSDAVRPRATSP
jgi:hypothetical protein